MYLENKLLQIILADNAFLAVVMILSAVAFVVVSNCSVTRSSGLRVDISSTVAADAFSCQQVVGIFATGTSLILFENHLDFFKEFFWDDGRINICIGAVAQVGNADVFRIMQDGIKCIDREWLISSPDSLCGQFI